MGGCYPSGSQATLKPISGTRTQLNAYKSVPALLNTAPGALHTMPEQRYVAHVDLAASTRTRCALLDYDPEPGVPKDVTPMAQCAFECSVFKVSAVHTTYRSWLRSSSTYEPSDPPIKLKFVLSAHTCASSKKIVKKRKCWRPNMLGAHQV